MYLVKPACAKKQKTHIYFSNISRDYTQALHLTKTSERKNHNCIHLRIKIRCENDWLVLINACNDSECPQVTIMIYCIESSQWLNKNKSVSPSHSRKEMRLQNSYYSRKTYVTNNDIINPVKLRLFKTI